MIIKLVPENFEEELLQCDRLIMLLIWDRFNSNSMIARKEQEKLSGKLGGQLKYLQLEIEDMPDIASRLPFPFYIMFMPTILYIYRNTLIDRALQVHINAIHVHLKWVHNYCKDYRLQYPGVHVSEELIHPDAAGWCTPGVNC